MENLTRRDALALSGTTLAGLTISGLVAQELGAQTPPTGQTAQEWPATLVDRPRREGFPANLPLNADGSAVEHPESGAGPIQEGTNPFWRTPDRTPPVIEYDYRKMAIKVDTRGLAKLGGTLHFSDLEKLPRVSHTFLLQCGAAVPRGVVKWTGVRFSDFADMLGVVPGTHYARFVASDRFYVDEDMETLRHPQVMLAWLMNDAPISAHHGAPLRLIIPFRYGNRSLKAIQEITFATPGLPVAPLPG
jgi:DMSO/TMAO reductase YedYZ molybdopterin-dependent catalytic subunit